MKFLVDAHLPLHLAYQLQKTGYDTIHTRDLPLENRTPNGAINQISVDEKRIVITKDADFVNSFMIAQRPYKLLLVSTGNIKNSELEPLFLQNIEQIVEAFATYDFIEIDRTLIIFHT
jgi:predicted nuclease of predicted toxin-antitoxin system